MNEEAASGAPAVGRYGPFAIGVVTISLAVFPIAFNLGAYHEVFYEDVFRFVVAATAGLAVSLLATRYAGQRRWFTNVALASPATWLLVAVVTTDSVSDAATNAVLGPLALVVIAVSVPTVIRMLIDMFVPRFNSYADRRLLFGRLAAIVLIATAGLLIGANNHFFLTCDDFKVAGSDEPNNCAPA
jgi:hypothetical protein